MNNFAIAGLKNRAHAKADELRIVSAIHRELFVHIACTSGVGFTSLMRQFGMYPLETWVQALADLIQWGVVFQMRSQDRYYTVAI